MELELQAQRAEVGAGANRNGVDLSITDFDEEEENGAAAAAAAAKEEEEEKARRWAEEQVGTFLSKKGLVGIFSFSRRIYLEDVRT